MVDGRGFLVIVRGNGKQKTTGRMEEGSSRRKEEEEQGTNMTGEGYHNMHVGG
jgi:hypothetical protein